MSRSSWRGYQRGSMRRLAMSLLGLALILPSDAMAPAAWRGHVRIDLTSGVALVDRTVGIHVSGLPPNRPFLVRAEGIDRLNRTWLSTASFVANGSGNAELADQVPIDGDYHSADASGLLWAMTIPGESSTSIFRAAPPTSLTFTIVLGGEPVASAGLKRTYVSNDVRRTIVSADGLFGVYFRPAGAGPFDSVITLGGSEGGVSELRAELLASHGYAALALGYFGAGQLPADLYEIPLEYFGQAIHWLQAQENVRADRLAVMGTSRGGEAALLVGSVYPEVRAVVAYVPSGVVWAGIGKTRQVRSAWSYQGNPVPFASPSAMRLNDDLALVGTPGFRTVLRDAAVERATIPVERINGPVLLVSGEDDQLWPSAEFSDRVMQRLRAYGHPFSDRHLSYPATGHGVGRGVPNLAFVSFTTTNPTNGYTYAHGGTFEGTARALEDSWQRVLQFLADTPGSA